MLSEDVPRLFDAVRARYIVEGGQFHLIGQSNGGGKAFRIAIQHPSEIVSLTVHTGAAWAHQTHHLARLHPLHVFMYCGDLDPGFRQMNEAARALFAEGHPANKLEYVTFPNVGHYGILDSVTQQGQLEGFWGKLEELRSGVPESQQTLLLEPPQAHVSASGRAMREL